MAGFDPISITPHGVLNRSFSAEGQLCHATDILERLTKVRGKFVPVHVPKGLAWESPAALRCKDFKTKDEEGYDTVRFVPEAVLQTLGVKEGQEVQLVATERVRPRVWNGDAFDGWTLSLDGTPGETWQEILKAQSTGQFLQAVLKNSVQFFETMLIIHLFALGLVGCALFS